MRGVDTSMQRPWPIAAPLQQRARRRTAQARRTTGRPVIGSAIGTHDTARLHDPPAHTPTVQQLTRCGVIFSHSFAVMRPSPLSAGRKCAHVMIDEHQIGGTVSKSWRPGEQASTANGERGASPARARRERGEWRGGETNRWVASRRGEASRRARRTASEARARRVASRPSGQTSCVSTACVSTHVAGAPPERPSRAHVQRRGARVGPSNTGMLQARARTMAPV